MKIDWARKLTSRKWWLAVATMVVSLILIFGGNQEMADKVMGTIMAVAAVFGYTIGEGLADQSNGQITEE